MPAISPAPRYSAIAQAFKATLDWLRWFDAVREAIASAPGTVASVSATGMDSSVVATPISGAVVPEGLYRVSVYGQVEVPGTVSSSLAVTIAWTSNGVACSQTVGPVTGNATDTVLSGSVLLASDANETIDYSVAYASAGATDMEYRLTIAVESVPQ